MMSLPLRNRLYSFSLTVRRLVFSILLLWAGCGGSTFAQLNTDVVMTVGRNALYYEDYALSIQYFNQVITARPKLYFPYYYRAIAKYCLGDYLGAIEDCNMSVECDPYIAEVYRLRAINYIRTENYESASRDYEHLIKKAGAGDRDVWYNLVLCKSQLGRNDEADVLLDTMATKWPGYARIYMLKAQTAVTRGDSLAADSLLRHTLALDSADVDAISALALLCLQRGNSAEAEDWYSKAIGLAPRRPQFYINRALARYQQTNLRGAMTDYNAALEISPNNYLAHYNRALLRMQVAENNLAIEDFDFVLSRHPDDRLALYNRAVLAQQTGDFLRAIKDYTTIIADFPEFQSAYVNRAYCYRMTGDRKRSDADDRTAMRLQLDVAYTHKEAKSPLDSVTRDRSDADIEDYDKLVTEDAENIVPAYASESRGAIQNKQVEEDYQPLFVLTFFKTDNGLNYSKAEQPHFIEVLNDTCKFSYPLSLSARELPVTEAEYVAIRNSRVEVERRLQNTPTDAWLHLADALYLSAERNYEQAMVHLEACETAMATLHDSLNLAVGMHCLRADVKVKQYGLKTQKKETDVDGEKLKYANAISDLTAALRLDNGCAVLYYNRATLYAKSKDYTKAVSDYNMALQLNPQLAEAYYNRGLVYIFSGEQQAGLADLSKAGELGLFTSYSLIRHYMKK